jgi:hypothetical protein
MKKTANARLYLVNVMGADLPMRQARPAAPRRPEPTQLDALVNFLLRDSSPGDITGFAEPSEAES